jgi:hypothetical protein
MLNNYMLKTCTRCGVEKSVEEFYRNNKNKELYRGQCKKCMDEKSRLYNSINSEKIKIKNKEHRAKNSEKIKQRRKIYLDKNPDLFKKWVEKNKEHRRNYINKYNSNPINKFKNALRARINGIMNKKYKNPRTLELVGCDYVFLMEYIEKKFTEGMTWENYGYSGWHIDHIIPLCTAKTEEELKKLYHYTNLQPLWAKDNLTKSKKLII